MNEAKLTYVYRHHAPPDLEWFVRELETGICVVDKDRDAALKAFDAIWAGRAPYQLREEAPPRPRRPEDPKPPAPAIEGDTIAAAFHRAVLKAFHGDHHGDRTWSAHEIVTTINRLWSEARGEK